MNDDALPFDFDPNPRHQDIPTSVILQQRERRNPTVADPPADPPLTLEKQGLGHFDVLETIGRGGFGIVVKAFDTKLQRMVAIKVMAAELAVTSPARKRFVREARAAAGIRHENVVQIYAVEEQPTPYLVMEFVPGQSLQQHLDRSGPLAPREVLWIGAQVARGLAAAHTTGLIHRDVKPANILLERGEVRRAKLTDFGLARAADDASLTQSGMVVGTPMYMAPEQARGESLDHRADLYSLGSVLYLMASGRPPFRAANSIAVLKRVAEDEPRPIQEIIPEVPDWLCAIIAKLQAKRPEDRFQTAAEVAELLEQCLAAVEKPGGVRLPFRAKPQPTRRWWPAAPVVAVLAVAALGFAAFRPGSSADPDPTPAVEPPAGPAPVLPQPPAVTAPPTASNRFTNALGMEFVRVPAGTSLLCGTAGKTGHRTVEMASDFYIGKFEVTHDEWEKVMGPGTDPSQHSRTGLLSADVADLSDATLRRFPVECVSWNDCQSFLRLLNRQAKETGWVYRLPTSTEWEYACRSGPGQSPEDLCCDFYAGEPSVVLRPDRANWAAGGRNRPCPVGSFPPNRLGIHDLHGNVFEYLDDYLPEDATARHFAGGYWLDKPMAMRAAHRGWARPEHRHVGSGLRLVRVPAGMVTSRQLIESVVMDLRLLNSTFTTPYHTTIIDDRVTRLELADGVGMTDLSPLGRMPHLEVFTAWNSSVSDLTPLQGLPLRELRMSNVRGLTDLQPLKGMQLRALEVWGFQGTDLTPLKGMPLEGLTIGGGGQKLDLTPLKGMPLKSICLNRTLTDDLSPLEGAPLEELLVEYTRVKDLSPLTGMKLRRFACSGTRVTDLSPLREMPLTDLHCEFVYDRDAEILRSMPALATINDKPAAQFWKDVEKK